MLGHMVYFYLYKNSPFKIYDLSQKKKLNNSTIICDVRDNKKFISILKKVKPDIIINCIGILIKGSNDNNENEIYLNSFFPHFLSNFSRKINSKVIHISTDCVFSGKKGNYNELDFKDADDIYGRSKSLGELNNSNDLTIRTSIIGPEIKKKTEGLFHWFMNISGKLNGYNNVYWSGVTTLELSKIIYFFIIKNNSGLINISNGKKINKYDLLNLIKKVFKKNDVSISKDKSKKSDKSLVSLKEKSYKIKSYKEMINELYIYMKDYKNLYSKIYNY